MAHEWCKEAVSNVTPTGIKSNSLIMIFLKILIKIHSFW